VTVFKAPPGREIYDVAVADVPDVPDAHVPDAAIVDVPAAVS
jgi:hypothetical protein